MKCPVCDHLISRVLYTKRREDGTFRHRECEECLFHFHTREDYVTDRLPVGYWNRPTIPGRRSMRKR